VIVSDARLLDEVGEPPPSLLRVRVDLESLDEFTLDRLQELFESKPGPCRVAFELVTADGSMATLQAERRVQPDRELVEAVRQMCGRDAVEILR